MTKSKVVALALLFAVVAVVAMVSFSPILAVAEDLPTVTSAGSNLLQGDFTDHGTLLFGWSKPQYLPWAWQSGTVINDWRYTRTVGSSSLIPYPRVMDDVKGMYLPVEYNRGHILSYDFTYDLPDPQPGVTQVVNFNALVSCYAVKSDNTLVPMSNAKGVLAVEATDGYLSSYIYIGNGHLIMRIRYLGSNTFRFELATWANSTSPTYAGFLLCGAVCNTDGSDVFVPNNYMRYGVNSGLAMVEVARGEGYSAGYDTGYNAGYAKAVEDNAAPPTFADMVFAVADSPFVAVSKALDFDFLGTNVSLFLGSLLAIAVVIVILRFVL